MLIFYATIGIIIVTITRPWKDKWALVIEIFADVHDQTGLTYTARMAVYGKPISAASNYQTLTQRAKLNVISRNFRERVLSNVSINIWKIIDTRGRSCDEKEV